MLPPVQPPPRRGPHQARLSGERPFDQPVASSPSPGSAADHRWRRTADAVVGCSLLFLILTIGAMLAFPGGAPYALDARHYLFFGNYVSDLGGTRTHSGRNNDLSRRLFVVALTLVGVSLAHLGPAARIWAPSGRARLGGALATVFSALSGLGFVALAFTPWNRDYDTHEAYARAAFGLLGGFVVVLAAIQLKHRAPFRWIAANVVYLVGLAGYALVRFMGPELLTRRGHHIQVAAQKGIVYASILNLGLQAWAVRSRPETPTPLGARPARPLRQSRRRASAASPSAS